MAAKQTKAGLPKSGSAPTLTPKKIDPQASDMIEIMKDFMKEDRATLLKSIRDMFQEMKEEMADIKKSLAEQNSSIREDMIEACVVLAKGVGDLEDKVDKIVEKVECRMGGIQRNVDMANTGLVLMQYRQMESALRVRGIKENRGEDLKQIVSEALAQVYGAQSADIKDCIDKIYRVNSWFARQKQLPRDVVIYFTTRKTRNEILQATYGKTIKMAGQQVLVLKEIPPQMRRERKNYSFLVEELKRRQLQFRWDAPTGLILNYEGKRHRLNEVGKARDFYVNILKAGQVSSPRLVQRNKGREEPIEQIQGQLLDTSVEEDLTPRKDLSQSITPSKKKEEIKEQRQTRAATKRIEKEKTQQPQQEVAKTEAVGGARPKEKIQVNLQTMLRKLQIAKDGK